MKLNRSKARKQKHGSQEQREERRRTTKNAERWRGSSLRRGRVKLNTVPLSFFPHLKAPGKKKEKIVIKWKEKILRSVENEFGI